MSSTKIRILSACISNLNSILLFSKAGAVPYVELKYYHLPESQQDSDMVRQFLGSPAGQSLVFVRAITVTVVVFSHDGSQMVS